MIVGRTLDIGLILDVLTNEVIFDAISEDTMTIENLNLDVIKDSWLSVKVKGTLIGCVQLRHMFNKCWDAHIHILPEHREHSREAGNKIWSWIEENLKVGLIHTNVPIFCPNVRKFLLEFKFEDAGYLKKCWLKNNELNDVWIMTRSIS